MKSSINKLNKVLKPKSNLLITHEINEKSGIGNEKLYQASFKLDCNPIENIQSGWLPSISDARIDCSLRSIDRLKNILKTKIHQRPHIKINPLLMITLLLNVIFLFVAINTIRLFLFLISIIAILTLSLHFYFLYIQSEIIECTNNVQAKNTKLFNSITPRLKYFNYGDLLIKNENKTSTLNKIDRSNRFYNFEYSVTYAAKEIPIFMSNHRSMVTVQPEIHYIEPGTPIYVKHVTSKQNHEYSRYEIEYTIYAKNGVEYKYENLNIDPILLVIPKHQPPNYIKVYSKLGCHYIDESYTKQLLFDPNLWYKHFISIYYQYLLSYFKL